jgi:hypothetical protein
MTEVLKLAERRQKILEDLLIESIITMEQQNEEQKECTPILAKYYISIPTRVIR